MSCTLKQKLGDLVPQRYSLSEDEKGKWGNIPALLVTSIAASRYQQPSIAQFGGCTTPLTVLTKLSLLLLWYQRL